MVEPRQAGKGLHRSIPDVYARLAALEAGTAPAPEIAPITTPDATDEATAIALANATKAKVNEIIAAITG